MVKIANSNLSLSSHLFGVSGSGKTRLSLDGLCQHWGFYISCKTRRGLASGSNDFNIATEMLQSMRIWGSEDISKNADAADRAFAMLLRARVSVLKQLLEQLPADTSATAARRRWVLAQVLPPRLDMDEDDLFVKVLRALRHADINIMLEIVRSTLRALTNQKLELFPQGSATPLFVVIDEAQVAAVYLKDFFRSTSGTDLGPILRQMYRFFNTSRIFTGLFSRELDCR